MSHLIQIQLADDVYNNLCRQAEQSGKTLEDFVAATLATETERDARDRLLELAGVIHSDVQDIAERHDYYLSKKLTEDLKPSGTS